MTEGFQYLPEYLDRPAQEALVAELRELIRAAPFYRPAMPKSGRPFSITMTSLGPLGWVSDKAGYRYQAHHPVTGKPWPPIPARLLKLWDEITGYPAPPECCLVNFYHEEKARMGLHRDADEEATDAPVLSLSLGDSAIFRIGGSTRKGPTRSLKLASGDVVVLGGKARDAYHGIDRILPGSCTLLSNGGRLNLTLRRVTLPE